MEARKYLAEMLGTFVLVFIGCGSAVLAGTSLAELGNSNYMVGIGYLGISIAFGVAVLVMVYAIGHISGCHINPAITIAMLVRKKIESKDAVLYIVVQCIGAIIAAAVLLAIALGFPEGGYDLATNGLGQNGYLEGSPQHFSLGAGFVAEVVFTFIFLIVIFGATSKKAPEGFAGIAIGFTLMLVHLCCIPVTGTSVNPARSLGPAVLVGMFSNNTLPLVQLWLFWVAPIIGALLAAFVSMIIWPDEEE